MTLLSYLSKRSFSLTCVARNIDPCEKGFFVTSLASCLKLAIKPRDLSLDPNISAHMFRFRFLQLSNDAS